MLTLFTSPKRFAEHTGVIQRNAAHSWRRIAPDIDIILFGNDEGTAETAAEIHARHVARVECNQRGIPLIPAMFDAANRLARHELLCFVNADIILFRDLIAAVQIVAESFGSFLMSGRRLDLDVSLPLEYDDGQWADVLRRHAAVSGRLHGHSGMDYFVFRRHRVPQMPPLAIGRPGWDNHLVYKARAADMPVIDATPTVLAIHQNHDYSHHPQGRRGVLAGAEAQDAWATAGHGAFFLDVRDATHILAPDGLRRKHPLRMWWRSAFTWPLLRFGLTTPIRIMRALRRVVTVAGI
jgi:hypothetical protein